jgi:WD40 repeat protein
VEDICVSQGYTTRTATVSYDKTLKIFDFGSNKTVESLTETSPLISLDWCLSDTNYLVYGSEGGDWVLKDTRKLAGDVRRESVGKNVPVRKVGFSPQEGPDVLAVGADNIYFFRVLGPEQQGQLQPFFIHRHPSYRVVDFCWSLARPYLLVSAGEHLSGENSLGSGIVNIFQPNKLLLMSDEDAAKELLRVTK